KHSEFHYDKDGAWAKSGTLIRHLLTLLKSDPYFARAAPKSTGKEYFSIEWLVDKIPRLSEYPAADVQITLCHLTAETIIEAIQRYAPDTERILICGGGIHNQLLIYLLSQLADCPVASTENYGLHPDYVEAAAFAWLARQTLNYRPGNLPAVTGADHPVILGGIYIGK
ncbi:MAG: anhydro-N-acetylmuramic acid kinase, partial [Gammaproteobacteria bacterium]